MTITVDEEDSARFYIKYVPVGSNVAYECSEVMGLFGMNANPGAVASKLPGYSKIQYNGQQVTLISKEELTSFSEAMLDICIGIEQNPPYLVDFYLYKFSKAYSALDY